MKFIYSTFSEKSKFVLLSLLNIFSKFLGKIVKEELTAYLHKLVYYRSSLVLETIKISNIHCLVPIEDKSGHY